MVDGPVVRPARLEDARGIAEVHVASWRAAYADLVPAEKLAELDVDERERTWRDRIANAEASTMRSWVAELDGAVVGYAFTIPSEDEDLEPGTHEVAALYTFPDVWGTGAGAALMQTCEAALIDSGVHQAALWCLEDNVRARRFYERGGWKSDKHAPCFRAFGVPAVRYRKAL